MATTFSYTDTWPANRDYLRFLIADTNTTYRKFWDQELDEIYTNQAALSMYKAAAIACEIISQDPDRLVLAWQGISGAMTIREIQDLYAQRAWMYHAMAG